MSHVVPGIHSVKGFLCDLCGLECDPEKEELNALDCTFGQCDPACAVYHQECLEKYLRKVNLEKNRKSGYTCPRGTGKGTKYPDKPCPGKINKSHPIHIRNDGAKKRRKAQMPAQLPDLRPPKAEAKEKSKTQEGEKQKAKERKAKEDALSSGQQATSKEEAAKQQKLMLQAAAYAARRDLGLAGKTGGGKPSAALNTFKSSLGKPNQTLEEFEARKAQQKPAIASAWSGGKLESRSQNDYGYEAPGAKRVVPDKAAQAALKPSLKLTTSSDKNKGETVGMESPQKEDGGKLSKAQRKNLKRAEKKAAERTTERMSVASSDFVSEAELAALDFESFSISAIHEEESEDTTFFDDTNPLQNECSQVITLFKAQALILQLASIGFPDWQCVPAVMTHGSDLEAAIAWMLDGSVSSEEQAQELLREAQELPQIDITEELARLQQVKEELRLELSVLQEEVIQQKGDVDAACRAMHDRHGVPATPLTPPTPQPASQEPVFASDDHKDTWGSQGQGDLGGYTGLAADYGAPAQGNGHTQGGWMEHSTEAREVGPPRPTWETSTFQAPQRDTRHTSQGYDHRQDSGHGFQAPAAGPYHSQDPHQGSTVVNNMERYNQLVGLDPPRTKETGQYQSIFGDAPQQQRQSNFSGLGGSELRRPTWDQPASNGWGQDSGLAGQSVNNAPPRHQQTDEMDLDFNNLLGLLMP